MTMNVPTHLHALTWRIAYAKTQLVPMCVIAKMAIPDRLLAVVEIAQVRPC